ncbi:serine hydrolase, partial [Streptomyces sp. DSM 41602]|nr:serine hydrolase [Streptomyces sp. DSM 41602]MEE4590282.1 serine hydrolase [Streptomyces sp. DSM 41602]
MENVGQCLDRGADAGDPWSGVDAARLARAAKEQAERTILGVQDMKSYLAAQVGDVSHREVLGPL